MIKKLSLFVFVAITSMAQAKTWFVAPNGNDSNPGNINQPLGSIQKAQQLVNPGDTVFIRGGKYTLTENQIEQKQKIFAYVHNLNKSGTKNAPICYWAYKNEQPVFDFSEVKPAGLRVIAFYVTGSWLHIKGLEVVGVQVTATNHTQSECFENRGSDNIYERLSMHDGQAIGIYHLSGSNNLFLNCDAYRNYDYTSENGKGGNTDGFGCHNQPGSVNNIFRGCRAWFNSDDGYDCINSAEPVIFENCWSFYNGYSPTFKSIADGNGFKAGGYGARPADEVPNPVPRNIIRFCLAVKNKANGFYSNHHISGSDWFNNSAYGNSTNFNMLNRLNDNRTDVPGYGHIMRNNLGLKARVKEVDKLDIQKCDIVNNYFSMNLKVTEDDFISFDESQLTKPRKADGSLPDIDFMRLKPGSKLVGLGR